MDPALAWLSNLMIKAAGQLLALSHEKHALVPEHRLSALISRAYNAQRRVSARPEGLLQGGEFGAQLSNFSLESQKPFLHFGRQSEAHCERLPGRRAFGGGRGFTSEKLRPTRFFLTYLTTETPHQRAAWASGKVGEDLFGLGWLGHGMEPLGICAKARGRLRSAEQKFADERAGDGIERVSRLEQMAKFRDACVGSGENRYEPALPKLVCRRLDLFGAHREEGSPIIALIAGIHQGIQRERINVGSRELLLD